MISNLRQEFEHVYRSRVGDYPAKVDPTLPVYERLRRGRVPDKIINGDPLSLGLLEDVSQYGRKMMKSKDAETQQLGKVISALAIATENDRIADIMRDLKPGEIEFAQVVIRGNFKLEKWLKKVRRQHREWLPEDAQSILDGLEVGYLSLFEMYSYMFMAPL